MALTGAERSARYRAKYPDRVKASQAKYCAAHPERVAAKLDQQYARHKARLARARAGGCVDCGGTEQLHFHHRVPVVRLRQNDRCLATMTGCSDKTFWDEADLCDVVCTPCHHERHRLLRLET